MPFKMEGSFEAVGEVVEGLHKSMDLQSTQGRKRVMKSMQAGAEIILEQMKKNAEKHRKSGKTYNAIKIMKPETKEGKIKIKVGIDKIEGADFFYPAPVEFGHGGPHPAPPNPFVRPAFDQKAESAYEKIKQELKAALDEQVK